ncbi:MAG: hypothetical protein P1U53_12995 [Sulfitobacter sp.]|nr:hypothetical protein [Sulfitobacter sp.]
MIPQAPEDLAVLDPESAFGPVADVKNDDLTEDDMMSLVVAALRANPPISHNIKGFDELMEHGISKIVTQSFMIDIVVKNQRLQGNAGIDYFDIKVKFTDAGVGRPTRAGGPPRAPCTPTAKWPTCTRTRRSTAGPCTRRR